MGLPRAAQAPTWARWPALAPLFLACSAAASGPVGIGFCLDQTAGFEGTGFVGVSDLNETQCRDEGHEWCPLVNKTGSWTPDETTGPVDWYIYSGCCTGRQGRALLPDPVTGVPTCKQGISSTKCTRTLWHAKLMEDLLGENSGYDYQVSPSIMKMNGSIRGGFSTKPACICEPSDPKCQATSADGTICTLCETSEPCAPNSVKFGFNFFKLVNMDLKTSELDFSVWFRQEWMDHRLEWDYQCYGGVEIIEIFAQPGALENSRAWVPDIEVVNSNEPLFGITGNRHVNAYSCWSGSPARGGCGYVWWGYPAIIKSLCKYRGLIMFPYDTLSCDLELTLWTVRGRYWDFVFRAGGGIDWVDDPNSDSLAGVTAGSSFQDYRIKDIQAKRFVVIDEKRPNEPRPVLRWVIDFSRSGRYYESRLVVPIIILGGLSFLAFWMDPDVGERLSFGITTILAITFFDVTAMALMPVCDEFTFLNYLSLGCLGFTWLAMLESTIVLWLFHRKTDSWFQVLVPLWLRRSFEEKHATVQGEHLRPRQLYKDGVEVYDRNELYRIVFNDLDENASGWLDFEELRHFGLYMMGKEWDDASGLGMAQQFQGDGNSNKKDSYLNFPEFVAFCDSMLRHIQHTDYLRETVAGFLTVNDARRKAISQEWREASRQLDVFARWTVPISYIIFLAVLYNQSAERLEEISTDTRSQALLLLTPLWALLVSGAIWVPFMLHEEGVLGGKKRKVEHHDGSAAHSNVVRNDEAAEDSGSDDDEACTNGKTDEAKKDDDAGVLRVRTPWAQDTLTGETVIC